MLAATAAWHAAMTAKQTGPAVQGMNKEERQKARAAARLAVSKTRGDARDAWAALIERGTWRTISGGRAGFIGGKAADILHPAMAMC
jgi:hypothetical protein